MSLQSRFVSGFNRSLKAICYSFGIENSLYSKIQSKDIILLFHSVLDSQRVDINIRNTGSAQFDKLLRYLTSHFDVVSLKEILETDGSRPRIAITFDDGLINNLRFALPILEKHSAPATIFVTTSWLRGESILWPDRWSLLSFRLRGDLIFENQSYTKSHFNNYRNKITGEKLTDVFLKTHSSIRDSFFDKISKELNYNPEDDQTHENLVRIMKGEEIRILAESPMITIGSHCSSHENLLLLTDDQIQNELIESKRYLEQVQNKPVDMIAYPFGLYNHKIKQMATVSGYKHHLAVNYLLQEDISDPNIHHRLGLYNDQTVYEQLETIQRAFR